MNLKYNNQNKMHSSFKRYLFLLLGTICFAAGAIGTVLPVLPTTPFLLLAAWFYLRSSKVMHRYLMNHRVFGRYITNYQNKSIDRKDKYVTLGTLFIGIIISCFLVKLWAVRLLMIGIALGVTVHLNRLKVIRS